MATHDDWLARTVEPVLEPDLPICDPHHHLWDLRSEMLAPRYLLDEFLDDLARGHNVVSTVFIECGAMFRASGPKELRPIGETEFVAGIAAMSESGLYGSTRIAAGIVGAVQLRNGDRARRCSNARSRRRRAVPGDPAKRHVGRESEVPATAPSRIRTSFSMPDSARDSAISPRAGCRRRLVLPPPDPCPDRSARAFPDPRSSSTTSAARSGSAPTRAGQTRCSTRGGMRSDARRVSQRACQARRIAMKVNGFNWHLRDVPPTSEELMEATRRYYEHTIEVFGVERCMFESNFPEDKLSCSYRVLWNSFKLLTRGLVGERAGPPLSRYRGAGISTRVRNEPVRARILPDDPLQAACRAPHPRSREHASAPRRPGSVAGRRGASRGGRSRGRRLGAGQAAAFGRVAGAVETFEKADLANRHLPELESFDRYGVRIDQVAFHPSYHELMAIAIENEVPSFAWRHPRSGSQVVHAALTYLFNQAEGGVMCPMAMTYSAVPPLRRSPGVAEEWIPRLLATAYDRRDIPVSDKAGATMGMFMTEKKGGSDVRTIRRGRSRQGARRGRGRSTA